MPWRRLMPHRTVRRKVRGVDLYMPWSHALPDYSLGRSTYGLNLIDLAAALARRGDGRFGFVDIGANIGSVTLDLAWRDQALKVDAYEPNPRTFDTLDRNVRENGLDTRVRTYRDAVTSQDGEIVLWTGDSSVLSSVSASAGVGGLSVSVPTISLDHAIKRTGSTQVAVKIDAEGAEVEMLESASDAALAAIGEIALEYHESIVPDARARCEAVLTRAGFACRSMAFSHDQGILVARRAEA